MTSDLCAVPRDVYVKTLESLLRADVRMRGRPDAGVSRFHHFSSSSVDVLTASGGPASIENGASNSSSVYLYRMITGRCRIRHDRETVVQGGEFVAFRGCRQIEVAHELPYEMIGVRLPAAALASRLPGWDLAEFVPVPATNVEGQFLFDVANDLLDKGPRLKTSAIPIIAESMVRLLTHSLTDVVLDRSHSGGRRNERHRERIENYCKRNLSSPELTVATIGNAVGLSPAHVHRVFRGAPSTLMEWVLNERLEASHDALRLGAPDCSVSKIAFSLGFKDAAHFSNAFKRRFGLCPRELREQSRSIGRHQREDDATTGNCRYDGYAPPA